MALGATAGRRTSMPDMPQLKRYDEKGNEKIQCRVCDQFFHLLAPHLRAAHDLSTHDYWKTYGATLPVVSEYQMKAAAISVADAAAAKETKPIVEEPAPKKPSFMNGVVAVKKDEDGGIVESPLSKDDSGPRIIPPTAMGISAPVLERRVKMHLRFGVAELPVFELTEAEQRLVPSVDELFEVDVKFFEDLALGLARKENVIIVGPTGSGKTTGVEMLAALVNQPLTVINMRNDIKSSSFIGQVHVIIDPITGDKRTGLVPGMLTRSMEQGIWFLVDEFDYAPSGILYALQRAMSHRQLILDEDGGRVINAHPDWRLLATCNTIGRGDDTGLYPGSQVLSEATLDRFATAIEHHYLGTGKHGNDLPDDDQEVVVICRKSGVDLQTVKKMVTVARLVRNGVEREECYCSFSTRRLLNWAGKSSALKGDWGRAARTTFLNKMTTDDKRYVEAIIDRVLGKVTP